MSLHRRPEFADIRAAYDNQRSHYSGDEGMRSYDESPLSDSSYEFESTRYPATSSKRPRRVHHNTLDGTEGALTRYLEDKALQESPHSSVESLASTVRSEEEIVEEPPSYAAPEDAAPKHDPSTIAATPSDFSELFPSHRNLKIRHDDSTLDGNMNLRIDTGVTIHGGRKCDLTLFHLRMHELKTRDFSLRRYCRDSGREVCRCRRNDQKPITQRRPSLSRTLSNALQSVRPKMEPRKSSAPAGHERNDSGYGSLHSTDSNLRDRPSSSHEAVETRQSRSTDVTRLEFSNYAQVDIKRTGVKNGKRYEFEYWGIRYAWRRTLWGDTQPKKVSYHLTKTGHDGTLAHIVALTLTDAQMEEERSKGGWIPPCSMWIDDESVVKGPKDLAE